MKKVFLSFFFFFSLATYAQNIIPKPVELNLKDGFFVVNSNTTLNSSPQESIKKVEHFFVNYVQKVSGNTLKSSEQKENQIRFVLGSNIPEVGEEGYLISVTSTQILVKANTEKGLFYGAQSLLQMLPAVRTNQEIKIPCLEIKDYPRFPWRGFMLDVSRHFFAPELIKEFIDLLAFYKMNTFHWHLVDGAGWRIEIKKYPKLTQQAAWRVDEQGKSWDWSSVTFSDDKNKATYGGYYTQEQAKEIVAYAQARNITVVPEIEMPGHSEAVMAAYPELSCSAKNHFGQGNDFLASKVDANYCAGNEQSFTFLQDVLDEVLEIFPSTYIHLGGDEVDKASWKKCAKCQARIKKERLKDENELQSYFMRRMEKFLISKSRKMIGWDEILEGGLAPEATVMSWRGEQGGIDAAKMKHQVIMSPTNPCYFDYYQGDPETEPLAFGGFNTLKKVYDYEPIPSELSQEEAKYVLGSQANLWTEYVPTYEQAEYMVFPRLLALAEVLWSTKESRNWIDFNNRLKPHLVGFAQKGIRYAKGNFKVDIKPFVSNGKLMVGLETENTDATIFYTTDGSLPSSGSFKYEKPIEVNQSMTIKASLSLQNKMLNLKPAEQSFSMNLATGKNVVYATPFSKYYPANGQNTLTDGIKGTKEIGKLWHAFSGSDMVATIDFGELVSAESISLGCIQNWGQWVFMPSWVKFECSVDGENFTEISTLTNTIPMDERSIMMKDFKVNFNKQSFKKIRVTAKNPGVCPPKHPGENQPSWFFVDEIVVE